MTQPQIIEREAKLFEAGSYPDRGIEISEEDLDRIIANTGEAPIRIEHTATPFDGALGVLKSVYRKGRELFGRLAFSQAAWELISKANARRISVAIRKDKSGIAEVSLVREPRIADAAVFSADDVVCVQDDNCSLDAEFSTEPDSRIIDLERQLADREAQSAIDDLKRQGKITPASEIFAKAILASGDDSVIAFGGSPTPASKLFRWFLESQPKVIEFAELTPAADSSDEPDVFAKLGVTSSMVEKHKRR